MNGLKVTLAAIAVTAVFLVPHFIAGLYAEPKPTPAATDCAKP